MQKFAYLLQSLKMQRVERIRAIVEEPGLTPDTTAKAKLLDVYGETPEKNVVILLNQMQLQ